MAEAAMKNTDTLINDLTSKVLPEENATTVNQDEGTKDNKEAVEKSEKRKSLGKIAMGVGAGAMGVGALGAISYAVYKSPQLSRNKELPRTGSASELETKKLKETGETNKDDAAPNMETAPSAAAATKTEEPKSEMYSTLDLLKKRRAAKKKMKKEAKQTGSSPSSSVAHSSSGYSTSQSGSPSDSSSENCSTCATVSSTEDVSSPYTSNGSSIESSGEQQAEEDTSTSINQVPALAERIAMARLMRPMGKQPFSYAFPPPNLVDQSLGNESGDEEEEEYISYPTEKHLTGGWFRDRPTIREGKIVAPTRASPKPHVQERKKGRQESPLEEIKGRRMKPVIVGRNPSIDISPNDYPEEESSESDEEYYEDMPRYENPSKKTRRLMMQRVKNGAKSALHHPAGIFSTDRHDRQRRAREHVSNMDNKQLLRYQIKSKAKQAFGFALTAFVIPALQGFKKMLDNYQGNYEEGEMTQQHRNNRQGVRRGIKNKLHHMTGHDENIVQETHTWKTYKPREADEEMQGEMPHQSRLGKIKKKTSNMMPHHEYERPMTRSYMEEEEIATPKWMKLMDKLGLLLSPDLTRDPSFRSTMKHRARKLRSSLTHSRGEDEYMDDEESEEEEEEEEELQRPRARRVNRHFY